MFNSLNIAQEQVLEIIVRAFLMGSPGVRNFSIRP